MKDLATKPIFNIINRLAFLVAIGATTVSLSACSDKEKDAVKSTDITTEGISARFETIADGENIRLKATFSHGEDNIELVGGDQAKYEFDGGNSGLSAEKTGVNYSYTAQIKHDGDADLSVRYIFDRTTLENANNSTAVLPEPFNITAPSTSVSESNPVTFSWSAPSKTKVKGMEIVFQASCRNSLGKTASGSLPITVDDNGIYQLDLTKWSVADNMDTCDVSSVFNRLGDLGTIDTNFKGGENTIKQVRTLGAVEISLP